jgi:hypothetical protein
MKTTSIRRPALIATRLIDATLNAVTVFTSMLTLVLIE